MYYAVEYQPFNIQLSGIDSIPKSGYPYINEVERRREDNSLMEKRECDRISAIFEFHCFNKEYFGTITNISEKGLFFRSQKLIFPLSLEFVINISIKEKIVPIPVRICRLTKTNGYYDGVGVELLKPSDSYLQFVWELRRSSYF